jgi:hypothetical protein
MSRQDPGPCPICGAPHSACTAGGGPILVEQLPATAAARASAATLAAPASGADSAPLVADIVQTTLPPGSFTSGTYRRPKKAGR